MSGCCGAPNSLVDFRIQITKTTHNAAKVVELLNIFNGVASFADNWIWLMSRSIVSHDKQFCFEHIDIQTLGGTDYIAVRLETVRMAQEPRAFMPLFSRTFNSKNLNFS